MKPRARWLADLGTWTPYGPGYIPMPLYVHARFLGVTDILLFAIECGPPSYLETPSIQKQIKSQVEHRGPDFLYAFLLPHTYKTSSLLVDPGPNTPIRSRPVLDFEVLKKLF